MSVTHAADLKVYSLGLVHISVCVPGWWQQHQVEEAANVVHPTGLENGWKVSTETEFRTGEPMPIECNTEVTRKHYLLDC